MSERPRRAGALAALTLVAAVVSSGCLVGPNYSRPAPPAADGYLPPTPDTSAPETPAEHEQRFHLADTLVIAAPLRRPRRQLLEDRTGERRRCLAIASKQEEARSVDAGVIGFGVTRNGLFGEDRLIQPSGFAQPRLSLLPSARERIIFG